MSTIETDLAPNVNRRRQEIFRIDKALSDLNIMFPGERIKPNDQKDPEYLAQRSDILESRRFLSGKQHQDRSRLRRIR